MFTGSGCLSTLALCFLTFLQPGADSGIPAELGQAALLSLSAAERQLVAAKASIMTADYRADLDGLARLREDVARLTSDAKVGYLAHYWAGFASWRAAINGASHGMARDDLKANLEKAAADFEASTRLFDAFADGYAAAASVNSWLGGFYAGEAEAMREHFKLATRLLARALELEPRNPRVLWVQGGDFLFKPALVGGSHVRAVEVYVKALEVAGPEIAASPLPDWGKPEALMALAYTHLNQAEPDLDAALEEALAALRLRPDWSYVRDILLPQIEAARTSGTKKKP